MTNSTHPHKRQKTSHAYQSVLLMTTLSLMSQYSQDSHSQERPPKRRRIEEPAHAYTVGERLVAEAMLCLGR